MAYYDQDRIDGVNREVVTLQSAVDAEDWAKADLVLALLVSMLMDIRSRLPKHDEPPNRTVEF